MGTFQDQGSTSTDQHEFSETVCRLPQLGHYIAQIERSGILYQFTWPFEVFVHFRSRNSPNIILINFRGAFLRGTYFETKLPDPLHLSYSGQQSCELGFDDTLGIRLLGNKKTFAVQSNLRRRKYWQVPRSVAVNSPLRVLLICAMVLLDPNNIRFATYMTIYNRRIIRSFMNK